MPDVVLCELEGVLADTAVFRRRALRASLATEQITLSDDAFAEHCAGLPVRAAVLGALSHAGVALDDTGMDLLVIRAEREFLSAVSTGIPLAPGARDFIAAAHGGTRLGIVTRARRRAADVLLSFVGMDEAFEFVLTADDVPEPKPDGAPYRAALARIERHRVVSVDHVVALEDGIAGVRAARAAGVGAVAVGPLPTHVAAEANAHLPTLAGQTVASLDALLGRPEVAPR